MTRLAPLAIILCLQAILLFTSLGMLPMWGDELGTRDAVAHPVTEILSIVRQDIHPPLYFVLLHYWPSPDRGIVALRAFSAMWALIATALLDLLWARNLPRPVHWLTLSLFAFSPCLLLYGRMARSYSMQIALALLAIGLLQRWVRNPHSLTLAGGSLAAILALLYTHYVPGIALLAAFIAVSWRAVGVARLTIFTLAIGCAYFPWLVTLAGAMRKWSAAQNFSSTYSLTGGLALEHLLKVCYGLVSLTIGESFQPLSLALTPVVLCLAVRGARDRRFPALLLGLAAVIGYLGVSRWSSYPFVPARILWLLPFLSLAVALEIGQIKSPALKYGVVAAIALSYLTSTALYFRAEQFLNPGYTAPLPEIAATLNREAGPADLIFIDFYNTDFQALSALLSGPAPRVIVDQETAARADNLARSARTIWFARNTRDVSPNHAVANLELAVCVGRSKRTTLLEPYAPWQRYAMKIAGFGAAPTHFYQLTECARP